MSEIEYSQLAGRVTEKLDNTAEYEDWLIIQNYVEELQSNLTKEQLAYINLRDTFNNLQQENQQLKKQLKQRDEVINKVIKKLGKYADEMVNNGNAYAICVDLLDKLKKYKGDNNE